MFTGIIETIGEVTNLKKIGSNLELTVKSSITSELKIDQSVSHNGVCLTVVKIDDDCYTVIIVDETLAKTNFKDLSIGQKLNLERSMIAGGRLDGHVVQGHVDQVGVCVKKVAKEGSFLFGFEYDNFESSNITVEKGSICINGISLTVINSVDNGFSVEIIPYTYENTNLNQVEIGSTVNLEFDILGKYLTKLFEKQHRELPNSR